MAATNGDLQSVNDWIAKGADIHSADRVCVGVRGLGMGGGPGWVGTR